MAYKILSLDGGGSWSLIQVRVLQDLYGDIRGHALLRQFDMVIANSGGSLVLAALCNDMRLSEIIFIFETTQLREKVFSRLHFFEKCKWRNIFSLIRKYTGMGPKYSAKRKREGLIALLGPVIETPLKELPAIIGKKELQLIITGFDYFRQRANFFRSNEKSETAKFSDSFADVTLAYAVHASSNAPVNYFDEPACIQINYADKSVEARFWDGAVAGFNNPVLAGLTEALTNNAMILPVIEMKDYCILSIGTGIAKKAILTDYERSSDADDRAMYRKNRNNPLTFTDTSIKFLHGVKTLAKSIVSDPPDTATFIAYAMLDPALTNNANIIRINPCLEPVKNEEGDYILPAAYRKDPNGFEKFVTLLNLELDAVSDEEIELIKDLCDKFIVDGDKECIPNQLIRGDPGGLFVLGQLTYQEAKSKWLFINGFRIGEFKR